MTNYGSDLNGCHALVPTDEQCQLRVLLAGVECLVPLESAQPGTRGGLLELREIRED